MRCARADRVTSASCLPTRISLPALEAELRRASLSYRAENSSVVYATTEIRQLLLALRAADDPTDTLALVETLRSPLYGCSDVELWEWKSRRRLVEPVVERAGRPGRPSCRRRAGPRPVGRRAHRKHLGSRVARRGRRRASGLRPRTRRA